MCTTLVESIATDFELLIPVDRHVCARAVRLGRSQYGLGGPIRDNFPAPPSNCGSKTSSSRDSLHSYAPIAAGCVYSFSHRSLGELAIGPGWVNDEQAVSDEVDVDVDAGDGDDVSP